MRTQYRLLRLLRLQQLCILGLWDIRNYSNTPQSNQVLKGYRDAPSELSNHQRPRIPIWSWVTNIHHMVFYIWLPYLTGVLRPDLFFPDALPPCTSLIPHPIAPLLAPLCQHLSSPFHQYYILARYCVLNLNNSESTVSCIIHVSTYEWS